MEETTQKNLVGSFDSQYEQLFFTKKSLLQNFLCSENLCGSEFYAKMNSSEIPFSKFVCDVLLQQLIVET